MAAGGNDRWAWVMGDDGRRSTGGRVVVVVVDDGRTDDDDQAIRRSRAGDQAMAG